VAEPVVAAFAEGNRDVFQMAAHGFRIFAVSFLFVGFNIYASSLFTALNDGRTSALLSFCHALVFLLGMLLLLPRFLGVDGVWLANPVAELLAMALSFWMFREKGKAYGM
jgi:Na+-driven multidrug efflux pump